MVRTKADAGGSSGSRKAIGGNAPRKALGGAGPSTDGASPSGKAGGKYAGGNPVCPRPTPDWQKSIGRFFTEQNSSDKENAEPCTDVDTTDSSSNDVEATDSSSNDVDITDSSKAGSSKDAEPCSSNGDS